MKMNMRCLRQFVPRDFDRNTRICQQFVSLSMSIAACRPLRASDELCHDPDIGGTSPSDYRSEDIPTFTVQSKMAAKRAKMSMQIPQCLVQRVCIWYSMRLGLKPAQTARDFEIVFGEGACSRRTIERWHKSFEQGRTKLGDMLHPG